MLVIGNVIKSVIVASITKGKRVSKADITKGGATPCIRYAELYTHYREVIHEVVSRTNVPHEGLMLSQPEDVIVPASGETKVDIARAACVLPERVALGSDLNILRSDLYGPFFSYLLNSPLRHTIARLAQGDSVAHLYPKQLSQVWLAYPLRLEQQKIAYCLGSLDDLIAAEGQKLDALRQHKQGLMQQLFPQLGGRVAMSGTACADLHELARHLRKELADKVQRKPDKSPFVLLFAFNGIGKTRLSAAFKDLGKVVDENDEVQSRDTLYFNAFTEDLFSWDNDLENDAHRTLKLNATSSFFVGLNELEIENRIRPLLDRYADFDFKIYFAVRRADWQHH